MLRTEYAVSIRLDSYIAHPYWPEKGDVIDIQKKSGMNRAKSDANREKALKAYLDSLKLTVADYEALIKKADRPWYRIDNDDPKSPIVIPRHHLSAALVQTALTAPANVRGKFKPDVLRHLIQLQDFVTKKLTKDEIFDRYVKLEGSNQRSRQRNEVIRDFEAEGIARVDETVKKEQFETLLSYALREVGVGASRKMGYGRGEIVSVTS